MNTSHLPYVIAVASTGSLSAARQLGISQPALSKHLKKLEQEAGVELFFHKQKKYIPTPAGRLYLVHMQKPPLPALEGAICFMKFSAQKSGQFPKACRIR